MKKEDLVEGDLYYHSEHGELRFQEYSYGEYHFGKGNEQVELNEEQLEELFDEERFDELLAENKVKGLDLLSKIVSDKGKFEKWWDKREYSDQIMLIQSIERRLEESDE